MTGLRWTADLDAEFQAVHRLHQQCEFSGEWDLVAEVIPDDDPGTGMGWAVWAAEDVQSVHTTLAAAKSAAEDWWDNACEDAWQARQEDTDPVTLRERAWMDHADAEILHDRRVA